jgi:hypothetical protein
MTTITCFNCKMPFWAARDHVSAGPLAYSRVAG